MQFCQVRIEWPVISITYKTTVLALNGKMHKNREDHKQNVLVTIWYNIWNWFSASVFHNQTTSKKRLYVSDIIRQSAPGQKKTASKNTFLHFMLAIKNYLFYSVLKRHGTAQNPDRNRGQAKTQKKEKSCWLNFSPDLKC